MAGKKSINPGEAHKLNEGDPLARAVIYRLRRDALIGAVPGRHGVREHPGSTRRAPAASYVPWGGCMKALRVSDGTIEALKWIGLAAMTGDHVNKYLFNATIPGLFEAGRLCLPIFVFVLAYNLARPGTLESGAYLRTMKRLAIFGALASVPFIALGGLLAGWWPLNVMFTLLVVTGTLYLVEKGGPANMAGAVAVFLVGGSSVEYWWPAVAFGLAVWWYCKSPSVLPLLLGLLACSALWFINSNWWALAALPLLLVVSRLDLPMPRLRWAFYAYYPLHLAALWLIRIPMSKAGYLFF